jgi:hypothetical protein
MLGAKNVIATKWSFQKSPAPGGGKAFQAIMLTRMGERKRNNRATIKYIPMMPMRWHDIARVAVSSFISTKLHKMAHQYELC